MGNYSFKTDKLPEPDKEGVIEGHNFTQGTPHTKIYDGVTGLTFRNCNLTNCDVPKDARIERSLISQVSFCSHLHDHWLEEGYISECAADCSHRSIVDMITIDGIKIDEHYTYEDKAVK